jgi:hypothetical protein
MFCLRTLRELKLLKFLSEAGVSENVSSVPIGDSVLWRLPPAPDHYLALTGVGRLSPF